MSECIFCRIVRGEIPSKKVFEDEHVFAFHDINPVAPVHVLIVPKREVASLAQFDSTDTAFLTDLYSTVQSLVDEFQLKAYRLIVNGGEYQDFPHLHFHLISDVTGQKSKV